MGNPTVTPLSEPFHDGGFLVSEGNGHYSRDTATLTGSVVVQPGTVLGQQTVGTTAAAAALGTNTGNGTFGAIVVSAGAQPGAYTVEVLALKDGKLAHDCGRLGRDDVYDVIKSLEDAP